MTQPLAMVENLAKVSVTVWTQAHQERGAKGSPFTFIYGINPGGITPFEKALYGKRVGDRVDLDLDNDQDGAFIGHLADPLREQTGIEQAACLHIVIDEISRVADREVIKAMANSGSCGDCDCGCGGH